MPRFTKRSRKSFIRYTSKRKRSSLATYNKMSQSHFSKKTNLLVKNLKSFQKSSLMFLCKEVYSIYHLRKKHKKNRFKKINHHSSCPHLILKTNRKRTMQQKQLLVML